ncbi:hypothetical protein JCM5350_007776 [Sporobolomyces pararoseus]
MAGPSSAALTMVQAAAARKRARSTTGSSSSNGSQPNEQQQQQQQQQRRLVVPDYISRPAEALDASTRVVHMATRILQQVSTDEDLENDPSLELVLTTLSTCASFETNRLVQEQVAAVISKLTTFDRKFASLEMTVADTRKPKLDKSGLDNVNKLTTVAFLEPKVSKYSKGSDDILERTVIHHSLGHAQDGSTCGTLPLYKLAQSLLSRSSIPITRARLERIAWLRSMADLVPCRIAVTVDGKFIKWKYTERWWEQVDETIAALFTTAKEVGESTENNQTADQYLREIMYEALIDDLDKFGGREDYDKVVDSSEDEGSED